MTRVIHCITCISIRIDKQVMQSAVPVYLGAAHVGVNSAKSSVATSNGKISDEPRVRARIGRFLRSIHSSATLKHGSKTLTNYHIFQAISVHYKLINMRYPLSIKGRKTC